MCTNNQRPKLEINSSHIWGSRRKSFKFSKVNQKKNDSNYLGESFVNGLTWPTATCDRRMGQKDICSAVYSSKLQAFLVLRYLTTAMLT